MAWWLPGTKRNAIWFDRRGHIAASLDALSATDTDTDGVVALGGELTVDTLTAAYRRGIFPWPHTGLPLLWFCPDPRAVLDLMTVHVPKSLEKERKKNRFTFTMDTAFDRVIASCQTTKRPEQPGTWITPQMQTAYNALHAAGVAHSVEAWDADGNLAGGLYGVDAGGMFTGESMFYREAYASKLCLLFLFEHLRDRGATWIDIQQMTTHFQQLGAVEIPRVDFLARLAEAQTQGLRLFGLHTGQ